MYKLKTAESGAHATAIVEQAGGDAFLHLLRIATGLLKVTVP